MTLAAPPKPLTTVADLLDQLGGVSPTRVRLQPAPGTATEADVTYFDDREDRLYELIDGVLVEKIMGFKESLLAVAIARALANHVMPRKLGLISGEAGMMRLLSGQVRIPDVAFISRNRLPDGAVPTASIPSLVPDLAVEVLSEGNTTREMARKREEYFAAGVRLVWEVDLALRQVTVYTTPESFYVIREDQSLDGGDVLPDFNLPLKPLFAELE